MGPRAGRSGLLALVALLVVAQSFPGGVTPAVAGHPYHHHHGGVSVSVGFGYGWPNYGYGYGYGWPYYYGYGWPYYGWPYGYYSAPRPVYVQGASEEKDLPATVETKIKPRKAQVVVDGEPIGKAGEYDGDWNVLFLEPGRHVVEFSAPDLMTFRTVIDARAGRHYRIQERLEKGDGIDPRSSSEVVPEAAEPSGSEPLPAAPTGQAASPQGSTALRNGLLWLRVSPDDAAVYLDGRFLGRADELSRLHGAIPVPRGEHQVDVVMPGHESVTRTVDVEGDEPVELSIDLVRERR